MKESFPKSELPISSRTEEIQHLRENVVEHASDMQQSQDRLKAYQRQPVDEVLDPTFSVSEEESERVTLDLEPEDHDQKMHELIAFAKEKGIKNALSVVQKMNDPHLEDDFHRFLVEYVREGYALDSIKPGSDISKTLNMTLFEVVLPPADKDEEQHQLAQLLSSMEQLYAGMLSLADSKTIGHSYFAIEIANPNYHEEFIFYVAVPADRKEFFEKHITAAYPKALLTEERDDYNIFNEEGVTVGSVAQFSGQSIFPIKTYDTFEHDPLNGILNSLSKVDKEGEGAAFQIVFSSKGTTRISEKYRQALEKLQKGTPRKEALDISYTVGQELGKEAKKTLMSFFTKNDKKPDTPAEEPKEREDNQELMELIKAKTSSPLFNTNIRLLVSSRTEQEAAAILSDMQAAFNQFENSQGGSFGFKRKTGKQLQALQHDFAFRLYEEAQSIPFNLKELTTLVHFHTAGVSGSSQLKKSTARQVAAPVSLSGDGIVLGVNKVR